MQKSKSDCNKLISNEDFLWCDKQDTDEKINRISEQWNLFDHLYFCDQFTLAFNYGIMADDGIFDHIYYHNQWELWHCNY